MTGPTGLLAQSVGVLAVWLTARETAALTLVVVTLLFFRAFRKPYLLAWAAGWMAYTALLFLERASVWNPSLSSAGAYAQAAFVLAAGLFATAALMCAQSRRGLMIFAATGWVVMVCAAMRPIYFPESSSAQLSFEIACRVLCAAVAIKFLFSRPARIGLGQVLFGLGLVTLNLRWHPFTSSIPTEGYVLAEILFGSSMLLVVLDESRVRTRRLAMLTELSATIARGSSHATIMQTALGKLASIIDARAAWFHILDGSKLVATQHIGLSPDALRILGQGGLDEMLAHVLAENRAAEVQLSAMSEDARQALAEWGVRQAVLVPVVGKESSIGVIAFGVSGRHRSSPEEFEFLETAAQKLGIAAENLKLSEQVLRSQRQWVNTFDSIQDLILAHDAEFKILRANQALLERLELSPAEIIGFPCEEALPKQQAWTGCPYCERGEGLTEGLDPCFGGQSVVSTASYVEQGQQKGTIHVIHDATDRQAAEEKYRMLFEQAQEGVFVATLEGDLLDCNDAFLTMLGYGSRDELVTLDLASVLGATNEERELFRGELETHNYVRNFEMTVRRKDGALLTAALSCFATRDSEGRIERYQGFVLDNTEKKRSEDEMRRRNRELNALNAMAVIATQSFDLDEILNLTLRQVVSLFGAETGSVYLACEPEGTYRRRAGWGPRSEARMRMSEVIFPDGMGELVMRSRAEVVTQDFLPHLPPAVVEFVCADRLPHWIWVLLWSKDKPVGIMGLASKEDRHYSSNDENLLVAISRQLATTVEKVMLYEETCRAYEDLRKTQEQLLQSEKMSAIGQLISGVAHELNNPLTAILGYAQLLQGARLDDRSSEYVGKLFKQAQRTHRVVQNLLSFARQHKPQKQEVDLRKVLEDTLTLSEYDLKINNVALERDIPRNLPPVVADPHQLEQVFLNIINNALDAMEQNRGRGALKVTVTQKDSFVCAEFDDNGPGIKEPGKIFDPFYTTKDLGKGTGLGLSICYGIIKEHEGEISARNRAGGGATIEVRLRASEKGVSSAAGAATRHEPILSERVLLVEDEEAVLEFERDVLSGAGAEVTTSTSVEDSREKIRSGSFDVIVMSGRMPGGIGAEDSYEWVAANCPGMQKRLLFTFSSLVDDKMRNFLQEHALPSLSKPFEVGDLISQVRMIAEKSKAEGAPKAFSAEAGS
ncbi:MAG TPA: ATP-binding protein [Terriglobales bacterium]|nr:ATP-binding protein [Terriglobales bacterium]